MRLAAISFLLLGLAGCSTATGFIDGARTAGRGVLDGIALAGDGILLDAELTVEAATTSLSDESE